MILKLITIVLVFILSFSDGVGVVINDVYAQQKKAATKNPAVEKKKSETSKVEKPIPDDISFEVKEFPDGLIGRRYNFVITPTNATPPYKVAVVSGEIPPGLNLNDRTGGIEGEPAQTGEWQLNLRLTDAKGKRGTFAGSIRVWRPLTVGEHGTFKGFDGLQMAINAAKDMDEIRIEKGIMEVSGLVIPENKKWAHGIKISGGWNEAYEEKDNNPEVTIFDGAGKKSRILTISNSEGKVNIENLTFRNSKGGAVKVNARAAIFTNCVFANNSAEEGGAIYGDGIFIECTFINNSASSYGGAVRGNGTFTNCIFTNNSAWRGGAVEGRGNFTDCTFTGNSGRGGGFEGSKGGAVNGGGIFTNCTFTNNSAKGGSAVSGSGGAVNGDGTFTNCTFTSNTVHGGSGGAVSGRGTFTGCAFTNNSAGDGGAVYGDGNFTNCTFTNNSSSQDGGAVIADRTTFTNCKFSNNSAKKGSGGAVNGNDLAFMNCIFMNNLAHYDGGAVRFIYSTYETRSGKGTFTNCIFTNNLVEEGSGGAVSGRGIVTNSTFYGNTAKKEGGAITGDEGNIINSIFSKNTVDGKDNDITSGGKIEIDYSLINYLSGPANYGEHNIMGDPKFVNPDNGDFHLLPESPAINAGKLTPDLKNISTDLDGKPRVVGGKIDMGAYEWQGKQ